MIKEHIQYRFRNYNSFDKEKVETAEKIYLFLDEMDNKKLRSLAETFLRRTEYNFFIECEYSLCDLKDWIVRGLASEQLNYSGLMGLMKFYEGLKND